MATWFVYMYMGTQLKKKNMWDISGMGHDGANLYKRIQDSH